MPELVKHHEFSPSTLERIENCPASWKMCREFSGIAGADARRGTSIHEAIYHDDALAELPDKDKELVMALRREYIEPLAKPGFKAYHELKVSVKDKQGNVLTEGTLDYLVISPDGKSASVIDWKFGNVEVTPAETNPQMWGYVEGVFQMFPEVETVYALIVQPVFGIGNFDGQFIFTRADEDRMLDRIAAIIERAKNADLENRACFNATSGNCRYCNKYKCPVYRQWMLDNMALMGVNAEQLPAETVNMTVDYADKVKLAKKAIEESMDAVAKKADACIIQAGGSANFRVCGGRTTRKTDWKAICAKHEITEDEIKEYTTETVGSPYLMAKTSKKATAKRLTE